MEKLLKKTDEAVAARRYSEALIWLKQARVLAPTEKQQEIDGRTREVQKLADAGSLFAVEPQSPPQQYAQPVQYAAPQPAYPPQAPGTQPYYYPQPVPGGQPPVQTQQVSATGREYHTPPQNMPEAYSFDKDDESDRELLRHDPYAEYIDFPEEYRVKDEAQMELVCC